VKGGGFEEWRKRKEKTFTRGSGDDKSAEGVLLAGQTASEGSALFVVTIDSQR